MALPVPKHSKLASHGAASSSASNSTSRLPVPGSFVAVNAVGGHAGGSQIPYPTTVGSSGKSTSSLVVDTGAGAKLAPRAEVTQSSMAAENAEVADDESTVLDDEEGPRNGENTAEEGAELAVVEEETTGVASIEDGGVDTVDDNEDPSPKLISTSNEVEDEANDELPPLAPVDVLEKSVDEEEEMVKNAMDVVEMSSPASNMQSGNMSMSSVVSGMNNRDSKMMMSHMLELETIISSLKADLDERIQEITELNSKLNGEIAKNEVLNKDLNEVMDETAMIVARCDALEADKSRLAQEKLDLMKEYQAVSETQENLINENQEFEYGLLKTKELIEQSNSDIIRLEQENESLKMENVNLYNIKQEFEENEMNLNNHVNDLMNQLNIVTPELENLRLDNTKLNQRIKVLEQTVVRLRNGEVDEDDDDENGDGSKSDQPKDKSLYSEIEDRRKLLELNHTSLKSKHLNLLKLHNIQIHQSERMKNHITRLNQLNVNQDEEESGSLYPGSGPNSVALTGANKLLLSNLQQEKLQLEQKINTLNKRNKLLRNKLNIIISTQGGDGGKRDGSNGQVASKKRKRAVGDIGKTDKPDIEEYDEDEEDDDDESSSNNQSRDQRNATVENVIVECLQLEIQTLTKEIETLTEENNTNKLLQVDYKSQLNSKDKDITLLKSLQLKLKKNSTQMKFNLDNIRSKLRQLLESGLDDIFFSEEDTEGPCRQDDEEVDEATLAHRALARRVQRLKTQLQEAIVSYNTSISSEAASIPATQHQQNDHHTETSSKLSSPTRFEEASRLKSATAMNTAAMFVSGRVSTPVSPSVSSSGRGSATPSPETMELINNNSIIENDNSIEDANDENSCPIDKFEHEVDEDENIPMKVTKVEIVNTTGGALINGQRIAIAGRKGIVTSSSGGSALRERAEPTQVKVDRNKIHRQDGDCKQQ